MPKSKQRLERLWAPWRMAYIKDMTKEKGCFFCNGLREKNDAERFIVKRSKHAFAILNIYPYNNGHVMVAPNRHVADIDALTVPERADMFALIVEIEKALKKIVNPEGFNIGMNIGDVAGAGVKDHIHMHIVPRWKGDTNFITSLGESKVISQSLEALYEELQSVVTRRIRRKRR